MGMGKIKTVGGGKAKPTADAFNSWLLDTLNSGGFSDTVGGIFSGGDNPLTQPEAVDMSNPLFAASQALFDQNNAGNIADVRSRFGAAGGAPRGSAAALAEALYRSDASSRNVLDMNSIANTIRDQNRADRVITSGEKQFQLGNQMQILAQLFNSFNQANQLGTAGAENVQQPSAFGQFLGAASTLAPFIAAPFTGGASLGLGGLGGGYRTPVINPGSRVRTTPGYMGSPMNPGNT